MILGLVSEVTEPRWVSLREKGLGTENASRKNGQ